ncbi:methyl-accepting chemotaxis protein [Sporichthya polymorpha]|uniref:methyl-accepting chemotaxis protein n=1 Tax=Sporichthya polymorpha TaxID=35751 RepID=UPI00036492DD|nr:methyl-accepting chemotaxis protein [Sporichthya polymorpha]
MSTTTDTITSAALPTQSGPAEAPDRLAELEAELAQYRNAVRAVADVCRAAATGDLEPRVGNLGEQDDLVTVRQALNHMLDLTDAFVREAGASLEYASDKRFFRRFLVRGMQGSFRAGAETINRATSEMAGAEERIAAAEAQRRQIATDFETAILGVAESVAAASAELESTARGLAGAAESTATRADRVAAGSVEASQAVTSVAAGVEEMVATVGEIEKQANRSKAASDVAVADAERADETVRSLALASREIETVVSVINHVASQTRLLALNATIEAARAGEAGKGFAVVANEVKELAARTGEATSQIAAQVEQIQATTERTVTAIDGITNAMRDMGSSVAAIAGAVGEQEQATAEISRNTQAAAAVTETLSVDVTEITTSTRETSVACTDLTTAALELSKLSSTLRAEIDRFLAQLA